MVFFYIHIYKHVFEVIEITNTSNFEPISNFYVTHLHFLFPNCPFGSTYTWKSFITYTHMTCTRSLKIMYTLCGYRHSDNS